MSMIHIGLEILSRHRILSQHVQVDLSAISFTMVVVQRYDNQYSSLRQNYFLPVWFRCNLEADMVAQQGQVNQGPMICWNTQMTTITPNLSRRYLKCM